MILSEYAGSQSIVHLDHHFYPNNNFIVF